MLNRIIYLLPYLKNKKRFKEILINTSKYAQIKNLQIDNIIESIETKIVLIDDYDLLGSYLNTLYSLREGNEKIDALCKELVKEKTSLKSFIKYNLMMIEISKIGDIMEDAL